MKEKYILNKAKVKYIFWNFMFVGGLGYLTGFFVLQVPINWSSFLFFEVDFIAIAIAYYTIKFMAYQK